MGRAEGQRCPEARAAMLNPSLPPPLHAFSKHSAHLHARRVALLLLHFNIRHVGGQQVLVSRLARRHGRLVRLAQLRRRLRLGVRGAQRRGRLPVGGGACGGEGGGRGDGVLGVLAGTSPHPITMPSPSQAKAGKQGRTRAAALPRLVLGQRGGAVGQGHRQLAVPQPAHALHLLLGGVPLQDLRSTHSGVEFPLTAESCAGMLAAPHAAAVLAPAQAAKRKQRKHGKGTWSS